MPQLAPNSMVRNTFEARRDAWLRPSLTIHGIGSSIDLPAAISLYYVADPARSAVATTSARRAPRVRRANAHRWTAGASSTFRRNRCTPILDCFCGRTAHADRDLDLSMDASRRRNAQSSMPLSRVRLERLDVAQNSTAVAQ
jgi:hypothetical protein